MDFLQKYFNTDMLFWGIMGLVGLMGFVMTMRIMRKGRETYVQRQKNMDERIQQTAQSARDCTNTMAVSEHVHIVAAALREQLELSQRSCNVAVEEFRDYVEIVLPAGRICISYAENTRRLRTSRTIVRGAGLWHVQQAGEKASKHVEAFSDLLELMQHIEELLSEQHVHSTTKN